MQRHEVFAARPCRGKCQGNDVRSLMKNGDVMHDSIINYLVNLSNNNKIGNSNDHAHNNKLVPVRKDHGNLFCLLNNTFTIFNKKRGTWDEETIKRCVA